MTPDDVLRSIWLIVLGGMLGLLSAFMFWLIYWGQQFDMPASDSLRMRSALIITTLIFLCILIIWFRKEIYNRLVQSYGEEDDEETE